MTEIKVGINAEDVIPTLNRIDAAIRRVQHNLAALKMEAKDAGISLPDLLEITVQKKEDTVHVPALLAYLFGISRSEARRCIAGGAVQVGRQQLTEEDLDMPADRFGDGTKVKLGSRRQVTLDGPLDRRGLENTTRRTQ